MKPREHIIYGGAAAAVLWPALGPGSILFFATSVLIDIDHYLDFVYHNGLTDLSFKKMFEYHGVLSRWWKRPQFLNIEVFHTAEFVAPLVFLSWWSSSAALGALTLGLIFHVALDSISLSRAGVPFIRAHSIVEYFIRKHALLRRGLDPGELNRDALNIINQS